MRATASFNGVTADEAMNAAVDAFDAYFGEGKYKLVSSDARPVVIDGAGRIASWEVEFEAEARA